VSKIRNSNRSVYLAMQCAYSVAFIGAVAGEPQKDFVGFLFINVAPCLMFFVMLLQLVAVYHFSDRSLILTTYLTQVTTVVLGCGRLALHTTYDLMCGISKATSNDYSANCSGVGVTTFSQYHAAARATVTLFASMVLIPVLFLLHMIPMKKVIIPYCIINGLVHMYVISTYLHNTDLLISAMLHPLFCSIGVCAIGYRAECIHFQTWIDGLEGMRKKDEWMATIAHNIGTPLTSIAFATSAMVAMELEDASPFLKQQQLAVDYLRGVYTSVMYRARDPEAKRQRIKLSSLIHACEDMTSAYGNVLFHNVALTYFLDNKLPEYIVSDWAMIQQCTINLVSNAQKHAHIQTLDGGGASSSAPKVDIKFLMMSDSVQPSIPEKLRIEVIDNGTGVNEETIESCFMKAGTGLGAVRLLVASMGGKSGALKNHTGQGSTFFIELSLHDDVEVEIKLYDDHHALDEREAAAAAVIATAAASAAVVLAAAAASAAAVLAAAAAAAAAAVDQSINDDVEVEIKPYDDHHALDESEAAAAVLAAATTTAAAVLAAAAADAAAAAAAAAATATATAAAVNVEGVHRQSTTNEIELAAMSSEGKSALRHRFLLVEDVEMNRAFIKLWLKDMFKECIVIEAENGEEGLNQYQKAMENNKMFDVVLMDIGMPIMDGFECLNEMQRRWGSDRPPTIAMTTSPKEIETQQPTSAAKFDEWWDKTDHKLMRTRLQRLLHARRY